MTTDSVDEMSATLESTTPPGSPQTAESSSNSDNAKLPPPPFLVGRKPVHDTITYVSPVSSSLMSSNYQPASSQPSSPSSSASMSSQNGRASFPSQLQQSSLGDSGDSSQLPSRHDPGTRIVQLSALSSCKHQRNKTTISNMSEIVPGLYFAPTPAVEPKLITGILESRQ